MSVCIDAAWRAVNHSFCFCVRGHGGLEMGEGREWELTPACPHTSAITYCVEAHVVHEHESTGHASKRTRNVRAIILGPCECGLGGWGSGFVYIV